MRNRSLGSIVVPCLVVLAVLSLGARPTEPRSEREVESASSGSAGALPGRGVDQGTKFAAEIEFPFDAGGRTFPAGSYVVSLQDSRPASLVLQPANGGETIRLSVITRLARQENPATPIRASLVFDSVGSQETLSEVWLRGEDGFLVQGTAGEHRHKVVHQQDQ